MKTQIGEDEDGDDADLDSPCPHADAPRKKYTVRPIPVHSMPTHPRENTAKFLKTDCLGCAGETYVRLADGRYDFAVFGLLNAWDHCPGLIILREAGGVDILPDGSLYNTSWQRDRLIAASNRHTADLVEAELFA